MKYIWSTPFFELRKTPYGKWFIGEASEALARGSPRPRVVRTPPHVVKLPDAGEGRDCGSLKGWGSGERV